MKNRIFLICHFTITIFHYKVVLITFTHNIFVKNQSVNFSIKNNINLFYLSFKCIYASCTFSSLCIDLYGVFRIFICSIHLPLVSLTRFRSVLLMFLLIILMASFFIITLTTLTVVFTLLAVLTL